MMKKMRTAKIQLIRFLFVLPLLALLLVAFRSNKATQKNEVSNDVRLQTLSLTVDTIPNPPPPPPAPVAAPIKKKLAKNPPPPPPPPPPLPPMVVALPEGVKNISVNTNATVTLKNGNTETYDLGNPEEKSDYENKYGQFPVPKVFFATISAAPNVDAKVEIQLSVPVKPAQPVKVKVSPEADPPVPSTPFPGAEPVEATESTLPVQAKPRVTPAKQPKATPIKQPRVSQLTNPFILYLMGGKEGKDPC